MQRPFILGALFVGGIVGSRLYHRRNGNWGATNAEATAALPGDELVPDGRVSTMAITIGTTPEKVWPWLVQMGADRAGLYSHEWVENGLFHLDFHNAERIVPEWQRLEVGDVLRYVRPRPGKPDIGPQVIAITPGRELITAMGEAPEWAATWQFILRPIGADHTRLLVRLRVTRHMPWFAALPMTVLEPGFDYMSIAMMRGIARRAEAHDGPVPLVA